MLVDKLASLANPTYKAQRLIPFLKKQLSVFLCGGAGEKDAALRDDVRGALERIRSRQWYHRVYYPEEMFIEVSLGHQRNQLNKDMLSLENFLAQSAHAVAILLNSPGTFAELGAFSNNQDYRNKLIVIIDTKYRHKRSFINSGPVAHLQKHTKSAVLFIDLYSKRVQDIAEAIADETRRIAKETSVPLDFVNLTLAHDLYLRLVSQFDPIRKTDLLEIARRLHGTPQDDAQLEIVQDCSVTLLARRCLIHNSALGLSLTSKGFDYLCNTGPTEYFGPRFLTRIRRDALNSLYRGKLAKAYLEKGKDGLAC